MHQNISKICRICLCNGSRNIFEKKSEASTQITIPQITQNVSSLERLVEKLRYVTMLKVEENENLPKFLCDSCIVQLNVAYSFKQSAIQSDIKMRQYVIECGNNVNTANGVEANALNHDRNLLVPADHFTNSPLSHSAVNSPSIRNAVLQVPYPVLPLIIKEEPIDYEILSDITIETNTEALNGDERNHCHLGLTPITNGIGRNGQSKTPVNGSMVTLNDKSLLISTTTADVDYISAYLPTPSASEHSNVELASTPVPPINSREITISESNSSDKLSVNGSNEVEITGVSTNKRSSTRNADESDDQKPNGTSLRRQLNILRIDMHNDQMSSMRFDERSSRTRDGILPKKNYDLQTKRTLNPLNRRVRKKLKHKQLLRQSVSTNGVSGKVRSRNSLRPRKHANLGDKTTVKHNKKPTIERISLPTIAKPPLRKTVTL